MATVVIFTVSFLIILSNRHYFSRMDSLPQVFVASFIIAFSGALMPGPFLTATIGESTRKGPMAGPLMIIGHAALELSIVMVLLFGLAPFLTKTIVEAVIALAGGVILIWLSVGMFRSLPGLVLGAPVQAIGGRRRLVLSGVLMSLANPYWTVWWVTVGLGLLVSARKLGAVGVAIFFVGHILADLVWYSAVSFTIGKGRRFLSTTVYRSLIGGCAVFLLFFAGVFIWHGIQKLS